MKHLVELNGGTVRAYSEGKGRGTTFSVLLPLTVVRRAADGDERFHPRAPKATPSDYRISDLSGVKVLVVDDESDARELLYRVLADCGAEVLTAGTAAEALRLVEQERPHLLVSDVGMPDVDGYELLKKLRSLGDAKGGKLPAIALTAFARSEDRTRAVEPSELVATVARVAGRTEN